MLRQESNGLVTYHFETLRVEGLVHAVFTRLGGCSPVPFASLNVGRLVDDDESNVLENHRRIYAHLGLQPGQVVTTRQVHGNRVAAVDTPDGARIVPNTDGLVTVTPGVALLQRFADCQPILLYDPEHHAVGLVHAGWRGVAQGVARRAVEAMHQAFGTRPKGLVAGLGPAIGPCCYVVGDEVAAAMGYALPDWKAVMQLEGEGQWRFDLPAANAQQLAAAGVRRIEMAGMCTGCNVDEFYSHRAEQGKTGRFAAVAYLQPRGAEQAEAVPTKTRKQADDPELAPFDSLHPAGFPAFDQGADSQ
ncbi:MAG: peptidoglycan editing factor PgeF [Anaerolineae bacterium]|nr:peptidoglycan editing factor PgeF [Anaerolineae bacterium]